MNRSDYLHGGLREIRCDACGVTVRARKNSVQHTSVQWTREAVRECAEFAATEGPSALVATCSLLRGSIDRAVREGRLEVAGD